MCFGYAYDVMVAVVGQAVNGFFIQVRHISKKDFDIVLSFGSEVIANSDFENLFKIYFGHHGDEGALNSDICDLSLKMRPSYPGNGAHKTSDTFTGSVRIRSSPSALRYL